MRMKRGLFSMFAALVLFLTGVLSGHYYAYYQWGQIYHDEQQISEEVLAEHVDDADEETADLVERQKQLREAESTNFFSQLGKTLGGSPR